MEVDVDYTRLIYFLPVLDGKLESVRDLHSYYVYSRFPNGWYVVEDDVCIKPFIFNLRSSFAFKITLH